MANSFLTSNLISKEAVAIFKALNSFIGTGYRKYENMFNDNTYKSGDTINVRLDNFYVGARGDTVTAEDIVEESIPVTIGPLYSVPIRYRPTDLQREIADFSAEFIMPAARRLVAMMNTDIANAAKTQINNFVGDPMAYVNSFKALDAVNPVMDELNMNNYRRYVCLNPQNAHELRSAPSLQNSFVSPINKDITYDARIGRLADFDVMKDNSISLHTAGTHATAGSIQVDTAVSSGTTILLKGLTAGATFKAGDPLSFAGVYKFDKINRQAINSNFQVTVTADATADGAGDVSLTVFPALVATGPRQNFIVPGASPNEIPVDTVVSVIGDHVNNVAYTERGLITCLPPLERMDSPESSTYTHDGISLRVSKTAEVLDNMNVLRLDGQMAFSWVPDQAVRLVAL